MTLSKSVVKGATIGSRVSELVPRRHLWCKLLAFLFSGLKLRYSSRRPGCALPQRVHPGLILLLTNPNAFMILGMKTYSTIEVAKLLKIGNDTLHRWIHTKKIPAPPLQKVGGLSIRLWSAADIEEVKRYKLEHYWGRGSYRKKRRKK